MKQFLAVVCTISWSCFWVFGYLALTQEAGQPVALDLVASLLGLVIGVISYLRLVKVVGPAPWRHVEQENGPD